MNRVKFRNNTIQSKTRINKQECRTKTCMVNNDNNRVKHAKLPRLNNTYIIQKAEPIIDLGNLRCSEPVELSQSVLQSTMKNIGFDQYLHNNTLNTFSLLEAVISLNQEILEYTHTFMSELTSSCNSEENLIEDSSILNNQILENKNMNNKNEIFSEIKEIINNCVRHINTQREMCRQSRVNSQQSTPRVVTPNMRNLPSNINNEIPVGTSTPKINTMRLRSHGKVEDHPNVMPKILERK